MKVPIKRVEMSNKINRFKRYEMQKASKNLFIANYKDNVLDIGNFRNGMEMYLRKMGTQKMVVRIFVIAYSGIKKLIQKS